MTKSRNTEVLRRSADKRRNEARRKIRNALRDMQRKGLTINSNVLAKHAKVARKTIYNHRDLLAEIKAAENRTKPQPVNLPGADTTRDTSITAALREQLRAQKRQYEAQLADFRAEVKRLNQDLAAAHGELHRQRTASPDRGRADPTPQRGIPIERLD